MRILHLVFLILISSHINASQLEPERIREIFSFIKNSPRHILIDIEANYKISTDLYEIFLVDKPLPLFGWQNRDYALINAMEKVLQNYNLMNILDSMGDIQSNINFINSLSPTDIRRIYNVREIYNPFAKILLFDSAPYLTIKDLSGIYRGRSSITFAPDMQRSFQKAFYTVEKDGFSYPVGHNVSNMPIEISSNGSFRIYENHYPIYSSNQEPLWLPLQPGTLTLSYEEEDMEEVEGLQYSMNFPKLTSYYYIYKGVNKNRALGQFFYRNLKDQIFKINDTFYVSYAFRRPETMLPETYFIMTKQCELKNINDCPL